MTSEEAGGKTSLTLEEISAEARVLAAEQDFGTMARRFLSVLHAWAAPSAVLCFSKDAAVEGGWRTIAELTLGPVSPAFERSIIKLIEDSPPGSLARPVPVRPRDDVPGAKVRDNWLVPWTYGEGYGYLFIRGIARTLPGFGDAVSLVSQALWGRLPGMAGATAPARAAEGNPTPPLAAMIDEAQRVSERLVGAIRQERERVSSEAEDLAHRVSEMETRLVDADKAKTEVEAELLAVRKELATLKVQAAAPQEAGDALEKKLTDLADRLAVAEKGQAEVAAERDAARGESASFKARVESLESRAKAAPTVAPEQVEALTKQVAELTEKLGAAEKGKAEGEKGRTDAESERDAARQGVAAAQARLEALEAQLKAVPEQAESLKRQLAEVGERLVVAEKGKAEGEKARADAEAERDAARSESTSLKARIESLESQAKAAPAVAPEQVESLTKRVAELAEKLGAAEKARADAETERDSAHNEATAQRARAEALSEQLSADKVWEPVAADDSETLQKQLGEMDSKVRAAEKERDEARAEVQSQKTRADELAAARESADQALTQARTELETAKREAAALQERIDASAAGQVGNEADLSRAKAEAARLWQTVESLQRQLQGEAERIAELANDKERLALSLSEAQRERETAQTALIAASEGVQDAGSREKIAGEHWQKAVDSFRSTAAAIRRTPFVPPTVRIAIEGAEEVLVAEGAVEAPKTGGRGPRVLFLDRDTAGIEKIAGELESAGIEVLVAHYPEEVSFFLKTPDARRLTAMVCDVMAFRGDQNLLELFRAWRQDSQNLALLLSFKADNPTETEKAQRIPVVLTAGYLTRPFDRQAVQDAVLMVARRQGGR